MLIRVPNAKLVLHSWLSDDIIEVVCDEQKFSFYIKKEWIVPDLVVMNSEDPYKVRVRIWRSGWELDIDGVGVTQTYGFVDAEDMAKSYISMITGKTKDSIKVKLITNEEKM